MYYDSHVDTPSQLYRLRDFGKDHPLAHVDFPKMHRGGVDGAFFALYTILGKQCPTPDAATRYALEMLALVYDAVDEHSTEVALAFSPEEARENRRKGRISIFLGMENALPVQESLSLLRLFYRMGVSYLTLTHNQDNAVADSAAEGRRWGGLSPFGREVVAEMNRMGMMIDLSHASDQTFWDCIQASKAPVIASHSCCRALCPHRRNLTDEMLKAIGEKDGYVGINLYPVFVSAAFGRRPAEKALLDQADAVEEAFIANPADEGKREAWDRMQERLRKELWRPGVKEVADHIDRAVRLAGIGHVGIGSDFDGIQVAPEGLEDISRMGLLFDELRRRGYSEEEVERIGGGNLMAVFDRVLSCSESAD
jgi:membrane dipeptidase